MSLEQFDRIGEKNEQGYTPSFGGNFSLPDVKGFDLNWFTYQGFNDFGFDFDALFDALAWVAELAINFDMIYRALRTIAYLKRIWGRSALMVPPIDVQSDLVSGSMAKRVVSPIQVTRRHCHHCHVHHPSSPPPPPADPDGRDADDVPDAHRGVLGRRALGRRLPRRRRVHPAVPDVQRRVRAVADRGRRPGRRRRRGGDRRGTPLARNTYRSRSTTPRRRATATGSTGWSGWRPSAPTRAATTTSGARARSATSSKRCRPPLVPRAHGRRRRADAKCYNQAVLDASWDDPIEGPPRTRTAWRTKKSSARGRRQRAVRSEALELDARGRRVRLRRPRRPQPEGRARRVLHPMRRLCRRPGARQHAAEGLGDLHCLPGRVLRPRQPGEARARARGLRLRQCRPRAAGEGINRCLWSCLSAGLYAFIGTADVDGHPTFEEPDLADKIEAMLQFMRVKGLIMVAVAAGIQAVWVVLLDDPPELVMTATKPK